MIAILGLALVCSIGGTVTGEGAVERARVIVTDGKYAMMQLTDDQGNFCFDRLSTGKYELSVQKAGYLQLSYPVTLSVEEDSTIPPLDIRLTRYGSLAGSVQDAAGGMLPGAEVTLWQRSRNGPDEQETTQADQDGAFRFSQLAPGTYYLSVRSAGEDNRVVIPMADSQGQIPREREVATFYSESFTFAGATALEVKVGQQIEHLVLTPQKAHLRRVTGHIADPHGSRFLGYNGESNDSGFIPIAKDGSFARGDLLPGKYRVYLGDSNHEIARKDIDLTLDDALDITLDPVADVNIPVTFRTEGKGPAFRPSMGGPDERIMLARAGSDDAWFLAARPDGTYRFAMVEPGTYELRVPLGGQKFYVKTVTYGGAVQDAAKIEIRGDQPGGLEVTLSPNVAEVLGKVALRANGEDVTVILSDGAGVVAEAGTDQKGRFDLPSVAPGKYWMLAIEAFDDDDWSPEALKALGSVPVVIELQEREKRQVDLSVIPPEEWDGARGKRP